MPVIKLNQQFINNELKCPEGKSRIEYCDSETKQLYIEVRATSQGQGTFYLRYKSAGITKHQKIGRTADMSLVDARKAAKTLKAEIELGADPRGEEKARKAVLTYSEYFLEHFLPYIQPRVRSWKKSLEFFRNRIQPEFGNQRLNQITRHQIQTFLTKIKSEGLAAATVNHHLKVIRYSLNVAISWDMIEINPAAKVPLFHEDNQIERYMDETELEALLGVLAKDENKAVASVILFLLSTGARLNEALSAKWDQVDIDRRVWKIPASNAKSKRLRSVPLNDSAIEVLNRLDTKDHFEYLFINKQTGESYTTIHKVWGRIRRKAGLPHVRIHDLRHQYASFLVNSGQSLYTVQQILGHSDPSVTQRYAHLSTKALQDAANSASIIIKSAMQNSAV